MASLDRALDVIEYVARHGSVRVGELCHDLKLPRPTAHRLLSALVDRGYLDHDSGAHLYRPGRIMTFMAASVTGFSLVHFAEPTLVRLREKTKETVNLGALQGGRITYAATLDGILMPRMSVAIGQDVPPHAAAVGKTILAALPEADRSHLVGSEPYPTYTKQTITTRAALDIELEAIAGRGYAIDNEEVDAGAVCIASVVRGFDDQPLGAISVSATTSRFDPDSWSHIGNMVRDSCAEVSAALISRQSARERADSAEKATT